MKIASFAKIRGDIKEQQTLFILLKISYHVYPGLANVLLLSVKYPKLFTERILTRTPRVIKVIVKRIFQ